MVLAIAFDMDGTLVDIDAAVRAGLAECDPGLAPQPQDTAFAAPPTVTHLDTVAVPGTAAANAVWASLSTGPWPIIDSLGAETSRSIDPFPDVLGVLRSLRGSYLIGVGSNGNNYPEKCGLANELDFHVYADVAGVPPKPAPAFFARLVQLAGVTVDEIAFVGDSLTDDVLAAQSFGMRAIWLNRADRVCPSEIVPDRIITSLEELPAALASLDVGDPPKVGDLPTVADIGHV